MPDGHMVNAYLTYHYVLKKEWGTLLHQIIFKWCARHAKCAMCLIAIYRRN